MKQKVHSVSYLAKAEFKLKNGSYDLVALPAGAEVVKASLELVGNINDCSIALGFKDGTKSNYFLFLNDRSFADNKDKTVTITKDYTITNSSSISATVDNDNEAKCILRVLYFLPSVIEVEY
ncbi:hypothetical protein HpHNI66_14960 [Helicobacter pylori]